MRREKERPTKTLKQSMLKWGGRQNGKRGKRKTLRVRGKVKRQGKNPNVGITKGSFEKTRKKIQEKPHWFKHKKTRGGLLTLKTGDPRKGKQKLVVEKYHAGLGGGGVWGEKKKNSEECRGDRKKTSRQPERRLLGGQSQRKKGKKSSRKTIGGRSGGYLREALSNATERRERETRGATKKGGILSTKKYENSPRRSSHLKINH